MLQLHDSYTAAVSTAVVKKQLHVSGIIIATAAAVFALPASRLTWQMCSAAAHGRPWAKQFLTPFEAHDDDGISKTLSGQLTDNFQSAGHGDFPQ